MVELWDEIWEILAPFEKIFKIVQHTKYTYKRINKSMKVTLSKFL